MNLKRQNINTLYLYGDSNIRFLLEFYCSENGIDFSYVNTDIEIGVGNCAYIIGELCNEEIAIRKEKNGWTNISDLFFD